MNGKVLSRVRSPRRAHYRSVCTLCGAESRPASGHRQRPSQPLYSLLCLFLVAAGAGFWGRSTIPMTAPPEANQSRPPATLQQQPTANCRMLRSPSHESVTTDLSLFSVSSEGSRPPPPPSVRYISFKPEGLHQPPRGPSPNPDGAAAKRPSDIPEILWFEEENDVIRSCAALSAALGFQKSFSTSDISQLPGCAEECSAPQRPHSHHSPALLKCSTSEMALNSLQRAGFLLDGPVRLDHASRSCSMWVAVGDVGYTYASQLPSPHGGNAGVPPLGGAPPPPAFTAADLVRSVNKKVRQHYIRRRLLTTYKALERLSQSEFNLDRLDISTASSTAADKRNSASPSIHLQVPDTNPSIPKISVTIATLKTSVQHQQQHQHQQQLQQRLQQQLQRSPKPLTIRDIERERGKPLSRYERNMMIFNWLHTLDDAPVEVVQ